MFELLDYFILLSYFCLKINNDLTDLIFAIKTCNMLFFINEKIHLTDMKVLNYHLFTHELKTQYDYVRLFIH